MDVHALLEVNRNYFDILTGVSNFFSTSDFAKNVCWKLIGIWAYVVVNEPT